MNARQRRLYERAQRVVIFIEARLDAFPATSKVAAVLERLKEALVAIAGHDVARSTGSGKLEQGSAGRRKLRAELRALVQSVIDTARTIALDHPDVAGLFAFTNADHSDLTLIAVARAAADAAAPLVNLFFEYNMPPTFLNDLRSKADALESNMALQGEGLSGRSDSNISADERLQFASGQIERLDTAVRNTYRDDPATLAAWERARRVESAPRRKDGEADEPPQPPPAND